MAKQKSSSYKDISAIIFQLSIEDQLKLAEEIFANLRSRLVTQESNEKPNQKTIQAMEQARKGEGKTYLNMADMFEDMEV
ncbi:MAG: hypothetical protein V2I97_17430 [Desulfococcaceae bacterium]|nr:hypothetical protein [Desulfococcaceae bacterium]